MRLLFSLFIILPVLEMWVLIEVGSVIGALPTVALVLLTAVIGAALLKQQGLSTLTRAQARLDSGQVPASEILEGLMLAVGGALLLTPGFITDVIGFCCLLPFTRKAMAAQVLRSGVVQVGGAGFSTMQGHTRPPRGGQPQGGRPRGGQPGDGGEHVTIEGEYKKEE